MTILKVLFMVFSIIALLLSILPALVYKFINRRIHTWPVVAAKITHTRLLNQLGARGETMIEAVIHFEYEFRGESFTSKTPVLKGLDLFPSLDYEKELFNKYKKGEYYNARVSPITGGLAYLEVAPLSRASAIVAPIFGLSYVAFIFGYIYLFSSINW